MRRGGCFGGVPVGMEGVFGISYLAISLDLSVEATEMDI